MSGTTSGHRILYSLFYGITGRPESAPVIEGNMRYLPRMKAGSTMQRMTSLSSIHLKSFQKQQRRKAIDLEDHLNKKTYKKNHDEKVSFPRKGTEEQLPEVCAACLEAQSLTD